MIPAIQAKVTDWVICKDGPWYLGLSNGGYVAYRIWQQFDGMRWFQRHEWKAANDTVNADDWIPGISGWLPSAKEAPIPETTEN